MGAAARAAALGAADATAAVLDASLARGVRVIVSALHGVDCVARRSPAREAARCGQPVHRGVRPVVAAEALPAVLQGEVRVGGAGGVALGGGELGVVPFHKGPVQHSTTSSLRCCMVVVVAAQLQKRGRRGGCGRGRSCHHRCNKLLRRAVAPNRPIRVAAAAATSVAARCFDATLTARRTGFAVAPEALALGARPRRDHERRHHVALRRRRQRAVLTLHEVCHPAAGPLVEIRDVIGEQPGSSRPAP